MGREIKVFKTINEQIEYLQINKSVKVDNQEVAREVLLNNNYYNLVSCGKIKFAKTIECGKFKYGESRFADWIQYFDADRKISEHLMKNMIRIERNLNSRIAHYMSELIEKGTLLTTNERNTLIQKIKSSRKCKGYAGNETWTYITKMTFGEMKKLLIWLDKNNKQLYHKVTEGYSFLQTGKEKKNKDRINELNHLRNNLFHSRPLNIYLTYGDGKSQLLQNKDRKLIINSVLNECYDQDIKRIIDDFYKHSDTFIKIKNSQYSIG